MRHDVGRGTSGDRLVYSRHTPIAGQNWLFTNGARLCYATRSHGNPSFLWRKTAEVRTRTVFLFVGDRATPWREVQTVRLREEHRLHLSPGRQSWPRALPARHKEKNTATQDEPGPLQPGRIDRQLIYTTVPLPAMVQGGHRRRLA